jgi:hypothetical protein
LVCFGKKLKFYVLDHLPVDVHGIFGANFFSEFKANIDYGQVTLTLQADREQIVLQMYTDKEQSVVLAARCEVFRLCPAGHTEDCVTIPEEVCEGVFVALS